MKVNYKKIKQIRQINLNVSEDVYDIEVPKTHNFKLANSCVVHNSKDVADGLAGAVFATWSNLDTIASSFTAKDISTALGEQKNPYTELLDGNVMVLENY